MLARLSARTPSGRDTLFLVLFRLSFDNSCPPVIATAVNSARSGVTRSPPIRAYRGDSRQKKSAYMRKSVN
ncbi:MAG: hypothetical protein NUK63_06525 [Candidatus Bathyarchaeum tardum]|nr:MAG: hypothetical protein NUK63_06525 [Candidatus Bathyarchaeum tardum]